MKKIISCLLVFLVVTSTFALSDGEKKEVEKLISWGEQAVNLKSFPQAVEIFEEALRIDPTNAKANFYAGVLKPFVLVEGIVPKIGQVLTSAEFEKLMERVKKSRDEAKEISLYFPYFIDFLLKPSSKNGEVITPWKTIADIQSALSREGGAFAVLEESISRLSLVLKEPGFSLMVNLAVIVGDKKDALPYEKEINLAEVALVKGIFHALLFVGNTLSAYELDTLLKVMRELGENATFPKVLEELRKEENKNSLTLREGGAASLQNAHRNLIGVVDSLVAVLDLAVEEISKGENNQEDDLLPAKQLAEMASDFKPILTLVKEIVSSRYEVKNPNSGEVVVVLNLPALFSGQNTDFKKLLPTAFDDEGEPTAWGDNTLGGIFPNGDWPEAMEKLAENPEIRAILQIIFGFFK